MPTVVLSGLQEGDVILIEADSPSPGFAFLEWTGDVAYLDDPNSISTLVTIPDQDVEVTAVYVNV